MGGGGWLWSQDLHQLAPSFAQDGRVSPLLHNEVVYCGQVRGGDRFTLSPASCHPFLREPTIVEFVTFSHLFTQCWRESTQPIYIGLCTIDPNFPTFTAAVVFAFLPMHTMPSSKAEEDACMHFRAKCTDATLMASGGSHFNGIFCTPCQYFSKHFYGILQSNLIGVSTFHTFSCTRYSALKFLQGTEEVLILISALWCNLFALRFYSLHKRKSLCLCQKCLI